MWYRILNTYNIELVFKICVHVMLFKKRCKFANLKGEYHLSYF